MLTYKKGEGVFNKIINKLPVELHIPGYQFCGPGTKLHKRLARGDPGINPLDSACKEHDIAYSQNREDLEKRHIADKILTEKAHHRVFASDASISEKAAAFAVSNLMWAKQKMGMSLRKHKNIKMKLKKVGRVKKLKQIRKKVQKVALRKIVDAAKKSMDPSKDPIKTALLGARKAAKLAGGKKNVRIPRTIPVPKVGGFLPFLIPIFAGLSAAGGIAGGAAAITKAVNDASAAKQQLEESVRHNKTMEAIALGKGMYMKPYKTGLGLHFSKN